MADKLPADRYIEEALRRIGSGCSLEDVKRDHVKLGLFRPTIELARMIEKHEPTPEPVDPDVLIAREVVAARSRNFREEIMGGDWDDGTCVQDALRAIKLARERRVL